MSLVTIIVVNYAFQNDYKTDADPGISSRIRIDSLTNLMLQKSLSLDSNVQYISGYFSLVRSNEELSSKNDTLQNTYRDMFFSSDVDSMHVGKVCMSFMKYNLRDYDSSRYFIEHNFNSESKYSNYLLGLNEIKDGNEVEAIEFFEKEVKLTDGYKSNSYKYLVDYYHSEKDYDKLLVIFHDPSLREHINIYLAMDLHYLSGSLIDYYSCLFQIISTRVNLVGVIAAIIIMLAWLHYLNSINLFDKIPKLNAVLVLVAAMVFVFLVFPISDYNKLILGNELNGEFWNDFKYSVFGIGMIEEFVKILPLLIILWLTKWIKEPYQYILYASISAMGFALVENIVYFQKHYTTIIHARSLTSATGHMIFSSIFAYGFILVKYKLKKSQWSVPIFLVFWLIASFSHGLYNFWLFMELRFFFYLFFFLSIGTWSKMINNAINNSTKFQSNISYDSARTQMKIVLALTGILFFEYLSVGYKYGSEAANDSLLHSVFNGSLVLLFIGSKLSSLDIVKGYWQPFVIKINPFGGQVLTQNFVNKEVLIRSLPTNASLAHLMPNNISGKIVDRLVLYKSKNNSSKEVADPYWFLLRLDALVSLENSNQRYVLIKLKDGFESLNEGNNFWTMVAAIPDMEILKSEKVYANQFLLYGWAFLNERPIRDKFET
ncbi:MAG: PrsW family intramembrane metalloprotease [Cyclobacteriaceae bacterium]